jgi:hypothetical protein
MDGYAEALAMLDDQELELWKVHLARKGQEGSGDAFRTPSLRTLAYGLAADAAIEQGSRKHSGSGEAGALVGDVEALGLDQAQRQALDDFAHDRLADLPTAPVEPPERSRGRW